MKPPPVKANGSANGHSPPARRASGSVLARDPLRYLTDSLKRQWKRYRKGLKRCQNRFSEGAVHESRVETRRLLSLLELLRPVLRRGQVNRAQAALKQHLDTFDDLRDVQVQLPAVDKMRRRFPAARSFHDYLLKREERLTRETRANVKRIRTRRLGKVIDSCREGLKRWRARAFTQDLNALLLGSIDGAFARAVELRRQIVPANTETIHRTRVAFKKLRYMVEILAEYLRSADEKLLVAMHRYQTMMGEIQDAEVVLRSFDRFLLKKPVNLVEARRLRRELLRRRQWLIRVYLDAADQLLEFWRLEGAGNRPAPGISNRSGQATSAPGSRRRSSQPKTPSQ